MKRGSSAPRVLIVGWGFIGAAIGKRLLGAGVQVTGLTRSHTSRTEAAEQDGARIVVGDVCQPDVLQDALHNIDHVVFSVGGLTPPATAAHPSDAATRMLLPLLAVLEGMRQLPDAALMYISSGGTIYGNPRRLPVSEDEPAAPISPYGALHLACESYAQMYSRSSGSKLQILRCANVYGPDQTRHKDQGAVAIFLDRIANGLPLHVYGDGRALRDYVYIDDVARAASQIIIDRSDVGVVNVGSGRGLTVLEIVAALEDIIGCKAILNFEPARDFDVHAVVLDVSRLQTFVRYVPTDFTRGVKAAFEASRATEAQVR